MPDKARTLIAWDTMVIIDCLQKTAGQYQFIDPLVKEAEDEKLMVVVSVMAIAETYKLNGRTTEEAVHIIDDFFVLPWVHPEDAGQAIAKSAAQLCRDYGIVNPDATHVATAKFTNCTVFLTRDGVRKRRNKKDNPPLLPLARFIHPPDLFS